MKTMRWISVGAVLVIGAAVAAEKGGAQPVVIVSPAQLKFVDVEGKPGAHMAVVDGDPSKGPSHFYMRFDGGFSAPMHHHTAEHYVTVVSGLVVLTVDGQEHRLPTGSYFAFTNMGKHATRCEAGADCVLFIDTRGKWDVIPDPTKAAVK